MATHSSILALEVPWTEKPGIELGFPGGAVVKNLPTNAGDSDPVPKSPGKISWRSKWLPTPIFLPGKSHGQRNKGLQRVGCD